jgi:hypothetical protein
VDAFEAVPLSLFASGAISVCATTVGFSETWGLLGKFVANEKLVQRLVNRKCKQIKIRKIDEK